MKIILPNEHEWKFVQETTGTNNKIYRQWSSNWLCSDNDYVELYIEGEGYDAEFTLGCFSGVPGNEIVFDSTIITAIVHREDYSKYIELKDYKDDNLVLFSIADWFCSLFCEWNND